MSRGAAMSAAAAPPLASIRDLAASLRTIHAAGRDGRAFARIYRVSSGEARCWLPEQLAEKYSLGPQDNVQRVISVTNRYTQDQAWWNPARSSKPQTFQSRVSAADLDTTGNGARCDFCAWQRFTARDHGFGRAQLRHAVTGSNLFKYAEPSHGVVLFRHHDPLAFGTDEVSDLLNAAWLWFEGAASNSAAGNGAAAEEGMETWGDDGSQGGSASLEPFFLWNCLPRAGASQFHGHAQVMSASLPVPQQALLRRAAAEYASGKGGNPTGDCSGRLSNGGGGPASASVGGSLAASASSSDGEEGAGCFYSDLLRAHRAVGLLRQVAVAPAASPTPGGVGGAVSNRGSSASLGSSSSSSLSSTVVSAGHRDCGLFEPGWGGTAWAFPSLAPHKDCEVFIIGSHLGCPALHAAVTASLRALIDGLGVGTFNAAALNVDTAVPHPLAGPLARTAAAWARVHVDDSSSGGDGSGSSGRSSAAVKAEAKSAETELRAPLRRVQALPVSGLWVPDAFPASRPPVVVRLVSRGKLDSPASDFGGLEVFGGASIGHTDPFRVVNAIDGQLQALLANGTQC